MPDDPTIPGPDGRVDGTTFPSPMAPPGAVPLGDDSSWIDASNGSSKIALRLFRPQPGDVMVIRCDDATRFGIEELQPAMRAAGISAVVVLPMDCRVHLEPAKLHREDRGYRETAVYGTDRAGGENRDTRGVHTGVPGLPDGPLTPHPESEDGGEDPCGG